MTGGPGFFIAVEGPSGVGKTTFAQLLIADLQRDGQTVCPVKQPSSGPLGRLARELTDECRGLSLACLVAADRYHQQDTEIRPALRAGQTVVCDRYVPSSLVLQVLDGVDRDFVAALNAYADRPDVYVFLSGDPGVARERASRRGDRDRFHRELAGRREATSYAREANALTKSGQMVLRAVVNGRTPEEVAAPVIAKILSLTAARRTGQIW